MSIASFKNILSIMRNSDICTHFGFSCQSVPQSLSSIPAIMMKEGCIFYSDLELLHFRSTDQDEDLQFLNLAKLLKS